MERINQRNSTVSIEARLIDFSDRLIAALDKRNAEEAKRCTSSSQESGQSS